MGATEGSLASGTPQSGGSSQAGTEEAGCPGVTVLAQGSQCWLRGHSAAPGQGLGSPGRGVSTPTGLETQGRQSSAGLLGLRGT